MTDDSSPDDRSSAEADATRLDYSAGLAAGADAPQTSGHGASVLFDGLQAAPVAPAPLMQAAHMLPVRARWRPSQEKPLQSTPTTSVQPAAPAPGPGSPLAFWTGGLSGLGLASAVLPLSTSGGLTPVPVPEPAFNPDGEPPALLPPPRVREPQDAPSEFAAERLYYQALAQRNAAMTPRMWAALGAFIIGFFMVLASLANPVGARVPLEAGSGQVHLRQGDQLSIEAPSRGITASCTVTTPSGRVEVLRDEPGARGDFVADWPGLHQLRCAPAQVQVRCSGGSHTVQILGMLSLGVGLAGLARGGILRKQMRLKERRNAAVGPFFGR
ncbi:hypothetical protein [Gephyromycinifex aptenodytis]|uniref:hypothetical protein n=1 Tax=Gephyromycinifex aptenodytis TaxID=2716227 RepID=UPI001446A019|nr:hypothetical protein [Gephyromycinifex aptenodytis]